VIPTALNAHAILTDKSNKYAFVPHLGTDQVFQFRFDAGTGKLSSKWGTPFTDLARPAIRPTWTALAARHASRRRAASASR
jgi:6-phosphogluconolactonase